MFELTRNPLLLINICLVHLSRGNLLHTRIALYDECTMVMSGNGVGIGLRLVRTPS